LNHFLNRLGFHTGDGGENDENAPPGRSPAPAPGVAPEGSAADAFAKKARAGARVVSTEASRAAQNLTAGFGVPLRILQNSRSAVGSNPFPAVSSDRPV
jgi:hypothetical protein